jgi:hypothetical protein
VIAVYTYQGVKRSELRERFDELYRVLNPTAAKATRWAMLQKLKSQRDKHTVVPSDPPSAGLLVVAPYDYGQPCCGKGTYIGSPHAVLSFAGRAWREDWMGRCVLARGWPGMVHAVASFRHPGAQSAPAGGKRARGEAARAGAPKRSGP